MGGPAIADQVLTTRRSEYGWDTPSALRNAEGYGQAGEHGVVLEPLR